MTPFGSILLKDVDRVEITTLIENYVDRMLPDTHIAKRPPLAKGRELPRATFAAEHGLSFPRFLEDKNGDRLFFPRTLAKEDIVATDFTLVESKSPALIAQCTIAVTGEVERTTDFEQGMPNAYVQADGHSRKDLIADEQSLIVQLKNQRLVLITGCCHAAL